MKIKEIIQFIKDKKGIFIILGLILLVASIFRFYNISYSDSYNDEVFYAFRSIGLIDYVTSFDQTTPWQWFESVPWWAHLSMHDHPIFFFVVLHWFIKIFGLSLFAIRLPAVLFGLGTVILVFLISKKLFNRRVATIATTLLSVQSYHVWISRVALQDGAAIFFIFLVIWLWLFSIEKKKLWLWIIWGASLGLAIITKYTTVIVIPMLLLHALIFGHKIHKNKHLWLGLIATVITTFPTWMYNLALYNAVGHFDFQISAFLKQETPNWTSRLGRERVGGLSDRFRLFFQAMHQASSWLFNILASLSIITALLVLIKKRNKALLFIVGSTILMYLWFFIIGSTYRFVVMIIPFFTILIAWSISELMNQGKIIRWASISIFIIILVLESLFTANSFYIQPSIGKVNIAYAQINEETQNLGFNELDNFLNTKLDGKLSALFGQPEYKFLVDVQNDHIKRAEKEGDTKTPILIIYDINLNFLGKLWTLQRRLIYEGWPAISDRVFVHLTDRKMDEYYREQGIEQFIYVVGINDRVMKLPNEQEPKEETAELQAYLEEKGIKPQTLTNRAGDPRFLIYEF